MEGTQGRAIRYWLKSSQFRLESYHAGITLQLSGAPGFRQVRTLNSVVTYRKLRGRYFQKPRRLGRVSSGGDSARWATIAQLSESSQTGERYDSSNFSCHASRVRCRRRYLGT